MVAKRYLGNEYESGGNEYESASNEHESAGNESRVGLATSTSRKKHKTFHFHESLFETFVAS